MAGPTFKLDYRGVGEILKSEQVAAYVNGVAAQVVAAAGEDADFKPYTRDRRGASISVPAEQQARDGALTRAAAACGLTVRLK
ncbi:hypothetical protein [Rhodococcus globerulus]|uniref:Uncharacterized protein n=1 Tax=Rhodococcus globerulus TaxID=33008 RepID=A0ABU4BS76_RHOGO|nr:hypothetical protein [Rhodococcus globerulus]MDV6267074.1 hypothetical protein [Rhodococcus globerulus]